MPTWCAVLVTMLLMGLSLAVPVQAQTASSFTPLSSIPGLTPPETASGLAIETLCPKLSPNVTTGGVGDLQIRCTEMIGNSCWQYQCQRVLLSYHSPLRKSLHRGRVLSRPQIET